MSEFLELLTKFTESLSGAQRSMGGQMQLKESEFDAQLASMRTIADYQTASNSHQCGL